MLVILIIFLPYILLSRSVSTPPPRCTLWAILLNAAELSAQRFRGRLGLTISGYFNRSCQRATFTVKIPQLRYL